jgi:hypothetical protein
MKKNYRISEVINKGQSPTPRSIKAPIDDYNLIKQGLKLKANFFSSLSANLPSRSRLERLCATATALSDNLAHSSQEIYFYLSQTIKARNRIIRKTGVSRKIPEKNDIAALLSKIPAFHKYDGAQDDYSYIARYIDTPRGKKGVIYRKI